MIALIIGLCTCLIFIFWQDCKFRHIHVSLPVVIFVCAYLLTNYIPQNIQFIATNVLFFSTTLFLLTLYMSLKNKAFLNPFKHYFGLGDLLFYKRLYFLLPFFFGTPNAGNAHTLASNSSGVNRRIAPILH